MNKKAIELSINFIVITILSLIVLGIGFYLVTHIFTTAEEYKAELDEQTQENILETLRQSGELVSLPINKYTILRGGHTILGIGVLNDIGDLETFYPTLTCNEAIDADQNELCAVNNGVSCDIEATAYCNDWITVDTTGITLENRKSEIVGIVVLVPDNAPEGTYGFTFKVCTGNYCGMSGSTQYGPTKKLYITVPQ